jgi:hypothetical protein
MIQRMHNFVWNMAYLHASSCRTKNIFFTKPSKERTSNWMDTVHKRSFAVWLRSKPKKRDIFLTQGKKTRWDRDSKPLTNSVFRSQLITRHIRILSELQCIFGEPPPLGNSGSNSLGNRKSTNVRRRSNPNKTNYEQSFCITSILSIAQ